MKPITPSQLAYLQKMQELAANFKEAYSELSYHFSLDASVGLECNLFIEDKYPFNFSFDEIPVTDWVMAIDERVKEYMNDEQATG